MFSVNFDNFGTYTLSKTKMVDWCMPVYRTQNGISALSSTRTLQSIFSIYGHEYETDGSQICFVLFYPHII